MICEACGQVATMHLDRLHEESVRRWSMELCLDCAGEAVEICADNDDLTVAIKPSKPATPAAGNPGE